MTSFIDPGIALQASQTTMQIIKDTMDISTTVIAALYELSKPLLNKLLNCQRQQPQQQTQANDAQPPASLTPEEEKMVDKMAAIASINAIRTQGQSGTTPSGEPILTYRSNAFIITAVPEPGTDHWNYHLYSCQNGQQTEILPFQEQAQEQRIVLFEMNQRPMTVQERIALVQTFCHYHEQPQQKTSLTSTPLQSNSKDTSVPLPADTKDTSPPLQSNVKNISTPSPAPAKVTSTEPVQRIASLTIDVDLEIIIRSNVYVAQQMPNSKLLENDRVTKGKTGGICIEKGGKTGTGVMIVGMSPTGTMYAARKDLATDQDGKLQVVDPAKNKQPALIYNADTIGNALVNRLAEVNRILPQAMDFCKAASAIYNCMPKLKEEIAQTKQATKSQKGTELSS